MPTRQLTPIGREALIQREAIKTEAYLDSVGIWTIGIGHTKAAGAPIPVRGMKITKAEALAIFDRDIIQYINAVDKAFANVSLADHQRDALISICFNIGPGWFTGKKPATFVKNIQAGDFKTASRNIMKFVKPAEVTSRRKGEQAQFDTPYDVALPRARSTDKSPIRLPKTVPVAPVAAPVASTKQAVSAVNLAGQLGGLWARIKGKMPNVSVAYTMPPGFKGDLLVGSIQSELRAKGFTEVGKIDGFVGTDTRSALTAIILEQGDSLAATQNLFKFNDITLTYVQNAAPKVADPTRVTANVVQVAQNAPEVIAPIKSLVKVGATTLLGGGFLSSGDLLTDAKETLAKGNSILDAAEPIVAGAANVASFLNNHPQLVLWGVGAFCLVVVAGQTANIVQMFRTKRIS